MLPISPGNPNLADKYDAINLVRNIILCCTFGKLMLPEATMLGVEGYSEHEVPPSLGNP